jgi:hypothetical protein
VNAAPTGYCDPKNSRKKLIQLPDSPILKAIYERRSVRHFAKAPVSRDSILTAIEAASWAPSGLNNQPWRFAIIWDKPSQEALAATGRSDMGLIHLGFDPGRQIIGLGLGGQMARLGQRGHRGCHPGRNFPDFAQGRIDAVMLQVFGRNLRGQSLRRHEKHFIRDPLTPGHHHPRPTSRKI